MAEQAMDAGIEVKVEDYDGTYACVFCSESVRGTAALKCSQCSSNPVHTACVAGSTYAWQCMTCFALHDDDLEEGDVDCDVCGHEVEGLCYLTTG